MAVQAPEKPPYERIGAWANRGIDIESELSACEPHRVVPVDQTPVMASHFSVYRNNAAALNVNVHTAIRDVMGAEHYTPEPKIIEFQRDVLSHLRAIDLELRDPPRAFPSSRRDFAPAREPAPNDYS